MVILLLIFMILFLILLYGNKSLQKDLDKNYRVLSICQDNLRRANDQIKEMRWDHLNEIAAYEGIKKPSLPSDTGEGEDFIEQCRRNT